VQPGLGVRVLADHARNGVKVPGAKTWVVQGRVAGTGQERRITLGPVAEIWLAARTARDTDAERDESDASKCSAREQARRMRRQMADGLDPLAVKAQAAAAKEADAEREQAQAVTLRQVADHYIANKKTRNGPLKPNTVRDINEVVDKAFATWCDRPIAGITRAMCEARHAELARGGLNGDRPAPTSARGAFVILRALINWAMDKYRVGDEPLIRENPVRVLKGQMAPPKVRTTKVPMDRIGHVWEALRAVRADLSHRDATHTAADALAFMLLTGGRSDEVLGLTWDRVHLEEDAGWWHLPTPKNSNPVTLSLSAPARALLAARPRRKGNEYVFQGRSGKARASAPRGPAMSEAIAAAGCHLDRHAFRRTFTTLALNPAIGDQTIAVLLFPYESKDRVQQMFSDLNRFVQKTSKSLDILYDKRDPVSMATLDAIEEVPVFRELTDKDSQTLKTKSTKLFTLAALYDANAELLKGREDEKVSDKVELLAEWWTAVASRMPDWAAVLSHHKEAQELRAEKISSHSTVLRALGGLGQELMKDPAWKDRLAALDDIDWSKKNKDWENVCIVANSVVSNRQARAATKAYVKYKLGMPLSDAEYRSIGKEPPTIEEKLGFNNTTGAQA